MLCSVSCFVLQGDNKKQREERERTAQLFRKSNKSSVSSLDRDVCSCLEGYWTDLCVFVCFRMYRPSQHSVCGAWHSSQGCVWLSLLFSDHYHCACFIGERVFGHLTPLQPPTPPLPEACRHDNHGLRIASAARHWGGLGSCRCVCVCDVSTGDHLCNDAWNNYCFL